MIGSTVSHYKILEKLGEGGMGEVFLAEDTKLERKVALKFLPPHVAKDAAILERFEREAKATAALQHPNIVTIHEIGSHEDRRFIAMAYIDGELLSDLIAEKNVTVGQAIDVGIVLSDALGEAHGAGIIHRDLKPENIIVDKRGRPHVLDFGLAVQGGATRLTQEGSTVGTLHYMSPEQSRGEELDERTDIFSLGAILYEMITCQKAFPGDNSAAILSKIAGEDPQPLSRYNNEVTDELERVVATALAKDRDVRFQTMSGVAAALKPLQSGSGSIISSAISSPQLARRQRSRTPWIVIGAAALVLVALIGTRFLSLRSESPNNAPQTTGGPIIEVAQIKTLAVLPLRNASEDPDEEYFADGMTVALISDLSRVSALKVIPRSTTMKYKDTTKSLSEIATEIGADALIDGSVQHAGDRVRIDVDLIPANSGERLWGDTYESEISDVLSLQSQIARAVTNHIKVVISPLDKQRFSQARSVNPDAHKAYLKGLYYRNLAMLAGLGKAAEMFERAIVLEPEFAPPYVGLAEVLSWSDQWEKSQSLAEKALELDPSNAEAHTILANLKMSHQWDWVGAREEIERARELQPNLPSLHETEGKLLLLQGKYEDGMASYRSALAMDPLSHLIACRMVDRYNQARQFKKAVDFGTEVADNFPKCPSEHRGVGVAYVHEGMYSEGIRYISMALEIEETLNGVVALGCAYARSGDVAKANAVLAELIEKNVPPYDIAVLHAALGNNEEALTALENAFAQKSPSMIWLNNEAMFDEIRNDPRFVKMVKGVGLPSG